MVYNAMKMFMEINPQLFDECSHEYTEHQNGAEQREKSRQDRWDTIEQQAKRQNGAPPPPAPNINVPEPIDEVEAMTNESQKRLNTLKLQEESETSKERPAREGTPTSVSLVCL